MFHRWVWCGNRFIIYDLYYVEVHPFYTHFIERCWILSCNFSASIKVLVWFIAFILIMCVILIVMWILSRSWIPGINTTWSGFMTFLVYCCIQFVYILLRIFAPLFISEIGLSFVCVCVCVCVCVYVAFLCIWYQGNVGCLC